MDLTHGKYLAVDYGDVRTGLAECDVSGMLACGICVIREGGMRNTAVKVADEAQKRNCKKIIVGMPRNMDGTYGARADVIRAFVEILASLTTIPVETFDERMTTMEAYRYLGATETFGKKRKNVVDALSAEIILQSYLDSEKRQK